MDAGFGATIFDLACPAATGLREGIVAGFEVGVLLAPPITSPPPVLLLLLSELVFVLTEGEGALIFNLLPLVGIDLLFAPPFNLTVLLGVPIDFLLGILGDTPGLDFDGRTSLPLGVAREGFAGVDDGNRFFVALPPEVVLAVPKDIEFGFVVLLLPLLLPFVLGVTGVIDAMDMLMLDMLLVFGMFMFENKDCCCCGCCAFFTGFCCCWSGV